MYFKNELIFNTICAVATVADNVIRIIICDAL